MKTCSLIVLFIILNSFQAKAQSQDLLDNTWYLEKVIIDDVDYFVPDDTIIEYGEFYNNFFETQSSCNFFTSEISFNPQNSNFSMISFGLTLEGCLDGEGMIDEEIAAFENIYLIDFINYPSSDFNNPFAYEITQESSTLKKLTITNTNGDQAVYYSETLSIQGQKRFGLVQLYPNPAVNQFSINSDMSIEQVKIYNLAGQIVFRFERETVNSPYDISSISTGVYIVEISSARGMKTVKKLIKN